MKEGADVAKSEIQKAEVEKCQDEREANAGELEEPKEEQVLVNEDIEKLDQLDGQENEKPCWVTPLQNGPAIILPKRKESSSFCCGCVVM